MRGQWRPHSSSSQRRPSLLCRPGGPTSCKSKRSWSKKRQLLCHFSLSAKSWKQWRRLQTGRIHTVAQTTYSCPAQYNYSSTCSGGPWLRHTTCIQSNDASSMASRTCTCCNKHFPLKATRPVHSQTPQNHQWRSSCIWGSQLCPWSTQLPGPRRLAVC